MSGTQISLEERSSMKDLNVSSGQNGMEFLPKNFSEIVKLSEMMSMSESGVPKHLRERSGACLRIVIQSMRWNMDPFGVADKSYFVNDKIAYEAQLIAAIINTRSPITGRLKYSYSGEGQNLQCTVTGIIDGESLEYTSPPIHQIPVKNSPLWKGDPEQQLAYFSSRSWARRHTPEILLGVNAKEEIEENSGFNNTKQVNASEAASRYSNVNEPSKKEYENISEVEDAEVIEETLEEKEQTVSDEENAPELFTESSATEDPPLETTSVAEQPEEEKTPFEKARPGIIEMMRRMMSAIDKRGDTGFVSVRTQIESIFDKAKKSIKAKTYPKEVMDCAEDILDLVMDFCAFNQDEKTGKTLNKVSEIAAEKLKISENELLSKLYPNGGNS